MYGTGGLNMYLKDASGYVGKGMTGGKLVIPAGGQCLQQGTDRHHRQHLPVKPPAQTPFRGYPSFAVRNRCHATIEGAGDHC